jgi:hypothetical protein
MSSVSSVSITTARRFVEDVELPPIARSRDAAPPGTADLALDAAKSQAVVVGSDVVSFVEGVTAPRREAIINSSLLAQLAAKKRVGDATRVMEWYEAYFDVLTNIGWVVQDRGFAEYQEQGTNFEAHKAVMTVAATVLGGAPTALAVVKSTLDALKSMNEGSPWIAIFNRESRTAHSARFQISLAEQDPGGQFFVTLMAFSLQARSTLTQVLFFKAKKEDVTLRHSSGRVTINTAVLDGVSDAIKEKLVAAARDYVSALPEL